MNKIVALLALTSTIGLSPTWASADEPELKASVSDARYSFGARVGGYGFRNTQEVDVGRWDDCRMDGFGVFAQRGLTKYLFAEAAFDIYSALEGTPTLEMTTGGMDRISGITTVAAGARIPWRYLSPYVQAGVGLEITRVTMAASELEDRTVLPMGFVGIGAELRFTSKLSLGANVRTNIMKHYVHDGLGADAELRGEYDAAAQGQFFVRYEM